jgi:YD repeat-containing protein
VTNRIVGALEHSATKLGKTLGEDAGKAVKDLYHSTGHNLTGIAEDTAATDAKHAKALRDLIRDGKDETPSAPHVPGGEGHLPHEDGHGTSPSGDSGRPASAREQTDGQHPNSSTRPPASVSSGGSDPVDMASGRMFLPQSDIVLPGALPLAFTRRVESGYRVGRWFGPSWSSTADQRLELDEAGVVFVTEDGLLLSYPHPVPGGEGVLPLSGPRWPLARTPGGDWAVHNPDSGRTWHFSLSAYDPDVALLEEITDRNGNWIAFDYDADTGAPTAVRHHAGYCLALTTEDGRITALHAQGQELRRYAYTDGNLTTVTNAAGGSLRLTYDDRARVTSWTDSNGRGYYYRYDGQDRCVAEGGEAGHITLRFSYDDVDPGTGHRVTTVTDAAGHTTRYLIDRRLQVVAETDPLGNTTHTPHDECDRLTAVIDPLGRRTSFAYDTAGRLTAVTRPDGLRTTATYNHLGLPVTLTDADGSVWCQEFDARGNRTALTDPAGAVTRYGHDERGRPVSVTDALGVTTRIRCDPAGLPVEVTDALGAVTTYHRDAFGRPTGVTGPLGVTEHLEWTVEGRLARRVAGDGSVQRWAYDGEGNRVRHIDAGGGVTRYEYTHFDLLAAQTGPDGARYEFTHDAALRLAQVTDPLGASWTYRYDPAGRLVSETDFDGRTLTYTHDAAGRLTSRTNPLGQTVTLERDALGQVVRKQAGDQATTYAYDPAGRLVSAANADAGIVFQRDRLGRIESETTAGRVLTHTHDVLGRPVRRTTPTGVTTTYAYDEAGNQTHAAWPATHPGADATGARTFTGTRIATAGTVRYEHDAAGRMTSRHKTRLSKKPDTWHYTWDAEDRLTAVTTPDGTRWRYVYDPLGRRIAKQQLASDSESVLEQTDFTWDGATLIEQTTTAPTAPTAPNPVTLTWDHDGLHPVAQTERITPARDRPALLRHHHRPHRHPHPPRRRNRRHSLAHPHHPLGHHHLARPQHRLHPPPLPRPIPRPRNRPPLQPPPLLRPPDRPLHHTRPPRPRPLPQPRHLHPQPPHLDRPTRPLPVPGLSHRPESCGRGAPA